MATTIVFTACMSSEEAVQESETQSINESIMTNDNGSGPTVSLEISNNSPEMRLVPNDSDKIATIKTSMGEIKALLYVDLAPITTENFIKLAEQGKYTKVPFHRVINDFMIQTGDFENQNGTGGYSFKGPGTKIPDEFGEGLKHIKGVLSMANAGRDTGGSQFFIVQKEDGTDWLDGKHAIFGYVFEGMDIVDKIASVETLPGDRPVEEVLILSVEISN